MISSYISINVNRYLSPRTDNVFLTANYSAHTCHPGKQHIFLHYIDESVYNNAQQDILIHRIHITYAINVKKLYRFSRTLFTPLLIHKRIYQSYTIEHKRSLFSWHASTANPHLPYQSADNFDVRLKLDPKMAGSIRNRTRAVRALITGTLHTPGSTFVIDTTNSEGLPRSFR